MLKINSFIKCHFCRPYWDVHGVLVHALMLWQLSHTLEVKLLLKAGILHCLHMWESSAWWFIAMATMEPDGGVGGGGGVGIIWGWSGSHGCPTPLTSHWVSMSDQYICQSTCCQSCPFTFCSGCGSTPEWVFRLHFMAAGEVAAFPPSLGSLRLSLPEMKLYVSGSH